MMLLTSRGFSNAYAAAFFLVLCQRIAALGLFPFVPPVEPFLAFAMRVADIGGLVESFDHVLFGLKHVLGRVFVEVRVVEHASALVRGEAQIIHHVFRQLVPVGCEFDALAERPVGDLVRDDDPLLGVYAHASEQALGFGPHVAAGPCGVRVGRGLDCGLGLPVEVFLAASGELGEVGELAEQESGHVFLAFGVHMHETAFMRVHVLHHLVELDIRCDFAELVVPVFAFGLQGWLDCRFGFARVPPHFEIDLRLAFRTDFLACLPFLFFDFLFDQFGYFRVTSAEGVDEFLRHSLDLVDHGFGAGVLSEGPRPTEPFCEQVLEQVLMHFADLDQACVDLPSVQRGPDLVGRTAHAVAEDDVLVWLRVAVATVVMVEHEAGHPVGRYAGDAALARARGRVFLFEIFDGHFRGPAHAFVDSVTGLFIAECPEDADAFRLSCGQVESGDRSFAVVSLDQFHVAEVLAVGRVASFVDELAHGFAGCRGADLAADELGSFADPIAWRVACCRIVCRWVGRVQRVVAIDRLPRVTERVFGVAEFGEVH